MNKKDFVLEIGAEELPARIVGLCEDIKAPIVNALIGEMEQAGVESKVYITPRRIIVSIKNMPSSYDKIIEGPPKKIAYDENGEPTKALQGFLNKIDAATNDIVALPKQDNEKVKVKKLLSTKALIAERLPKVFSVFASQKNMRWDETNLLFPRPIRWLLAMLGNEVIISNIGNISAGNITYGHHLLNPQSIKIKNPGDFFKKLKRCNVICDFNERKHIILQYLEKNKWHKNEQLLDEVAGLVEYPAFIDGDFNKDYLKLPREILIASASKNQRIFPLQDKNANLINKFTGVINGKLKQAKRIKLHYEQVLDAKLKDALFFYNEDLKKPLSGKTKLLKDVVFHKKLGSYMDKAQRMAKLAGFFKDAFKLTDADYDNIKKACMLCKADLLTQVVGEFPSLQGIVGKYYALAEGIDKEVATAIEEHYRPRFSDDILPQTKLGATLALLDKLDSVICHFKAGNQPKANWDLYALRRQSIAIINIILNKKMNLSLSDIFDRVFETAPGSADKNKLKNDFMEFMKERLLAIIQQQHNFRHDLVSAAITSGFDDIYIFLLRLEALNNIINEFYFEQARCVVERTNNITKNTLQFNGSIDTALFQLDLEKMLFEKYNNIKDKIKNLAQKNDYDGATKLYSETFYKIIDEFFNKVMVNVDDEKIKNNRLKLIKDVNTLYVENIADLSKIVTRNR